MTKNYRNKLNEIRKNKKIHQKENPKDPTAEKEKRLGDIDFIVNPNTPYQGKLNKKNKDKKEEGNNPPFNPKP